MNKLDMWAIYNDQGVIAQTSDGAHLIFDDDSDIQRWLASNPGNWTVRYVQVLEPSDE